MLVELLHLQTDVVDRGLRLETPLLESVRGLLERGNTSLVVILEIQELALPSGVTVGEALVPLGIVLGESLGDLVDEALGYLIDGNLGFRIHGVVMVLKMSVVVVRGRKIQDGDPHHKSIKRGWELQDLRD